METGSLGNHGEIFVWLYLVLIGFFALWESLAPRRDPSKSLRIRWLNHALLFGLSVLLVRIVLPFGAVWAAVLAGGNDWGLLNVVESPVWLQIVLVFLFLDLSRYGSHYLLHQVPMLWRVHRIHHTDQDVDISTSLRFHPVEILLQTGIAMCLIVILGFDPIAVLLFECCKLSANFFVHGNIRLSARTDGLLRMVIVTPDMHRVHHSALEDEYNTNFGVLFSCWDRLFKTYSVLPWTNHQFMPLGLDGFEGAENDRIDRLLADPLVEPPAAYGYDWRDSV